MGINKQLIMHVCKQKKEATAWVWSLNYQVFIAHALINFWQVVKLPGIHRPRIN